jgi:hypothetical protein
MTRILLSQGEAYNLRVRPSQARVRVVSGQAWLSYEGEDYILSYGEEMTLPNGRFEAVITALFNKPVTLELSPR